MIINWSQMVDSFIASFTYDPWDDRQTRRKSLFALGCPSLFRTHNQHLLLLPTLSLVKMNPGLSGNLLVLQAKRGSYQLAYGRMCARVCTCVCVCVSTLIYVNTQLFTKEAVPIVKVRHCSGEMTVFAHQR